MKKTLLTLFTAALTGVAFAQAPRMQLYEVFSGENCPPCASANPTTKALLDANSANIIGLKYQVPIPSAGPIHNQNTIDPNARRSYYGINSAPNARHDGATIGSGHSLNLTQALITQRQAVTSPFTIQLAHNLSQNRDSINITMTITAVQALTGGTWFARIALVEKHMSFATPPGTNGETDFYDVTRRMYPNATGTALPSTWTVGQEQLVTINAPLPTFIRDSAEIRVIAFVQNDVTKEIAQAARTNPQLLSVNSKLEFTSGAFYNCQPNVTPSVTVVNQGADAITTMEIRQTVGSQIQTVNWTGNLASGGSTNVNLNSTALNAGRNNFDFRILTMNGRPHPSPGAVRSTVTGALFLGDAPTSSAFSSFAGSFPPAGWGVNNGATAANGWALGLLGANGTTRSARINFYDIPSGDIDDFYMPRMNFSQAGPNNELTFHMAHAQYNTSTADRLLVEASTNCGQTWTTLYDKAGASLATRAAMTGAFTSPVAADWRVERVNLGSLAGQADVVLRFRGISNYGNNLFIDEVSISNAVSVLEPTSLPLRIYPNPVKDVLVVEVPEQVGSATIEVLNSLGQVVWRQKHNAQEGSRANVQVASLPVGIYTVQISHDAGLFTNKMVKQ